MKLAIHDTNIKGFFSKRWIAYCEKNQIPYKVVNCYSNDIISELNDCDGLLWHFSQGIAKDYLVANNLISSLEVAGKKTFPNLNSCWHFDDKVAQKYLLEAINAPLIKSWVFYDREEALKWIEICTFPKVFKLKGGAGSANVKLVKNTKQAKHLVLKSFGKGFRQFNRFELFFYELKKWKTQKSTIKNVFLSFLKIFKNSDYEKVRGKEKGYAYFQEFLPYNDSDIRIVVIGKRAFGIKRMVRKNDFRASGSGNIIYDKKQIDVNCVKIAFETTKKLKANCLAFDFLFDTNGKPLIAEISFGFVQEGYDNCKGYWDDCLRWYEGSFIPQGWMVEDMVTSIRQS